MLLDCLSIMLKKLNLNFSKKAVWSCLIILTTFRMIADISSRSCLALFINNSVYVEQAGRVNGLAFSVQEIFR